MQQSFYNKLHIINFVLIVSCTVMIALVVVLFLTPIMEFGGPLPNDSRIQNDIFKQGGPNGPDNGPINRPIIAPNIPNELSELIVEEILEKESVIAFKETFPDYEETFASNRGVEYIIESRNTITDNVLVLTINYYARGPPGQSANFDVRENLQCIVDKGLYGNQGVFQEMENTGKPNLFVDKYVRNSECLADYWIPEMLEVKNLEPVFVD